MIDGTWKRELEKAWGGQGGCCRSWSIKFHMKNLSVWKQGIKTGFTATAGKHSSLPGDHHCRGKLRYRAKGSDSNPIQMYFFKMGHSRTLFLYFRLFDCTIGRYDFAEVWIWTADLWCWKQPLYLLSHNHCPNVLSIDFYYRNISF